MAQAAATAGKTTTQAKVPVWRWTGKTRLVA